MRTYKKSGKLYNRKHWRTSGERTAPKHGDNIQCCLCEQIAHFKVVGNGYCLNHKREAVEAQSKQSTLGKYDGWSAEYVGLPTGAALSQRSIA